jgi:hypothetical protein
VRARRLAHAVGERAERSRLLQYAEELEEQADRLERASSPAKPQVVEQQQQQVQQQQGSSDETDDPPGGKKSD